VVLKNTGTTKVSLSDIQLSWNQAINGLLKKVKFDADVLYDNPDLSSPMHLTTGQFATGKKREIDKGHSRTLIFEFANNADKFLTNYAGQIQIGTCTITLP